MVYRVRSDDLTWQRSLMKGFWEDVATMAMVCVPFARNRVCVLVGVLEIRALLLGVYIKASDFLLNSQIGSSCIKPYTLASIRIAMPAS